MHEYPADRKRLYQERLFHETQAQNRASRPGFLLSLVQPDEEYLNHASWVRPGMEALGDIEDKTVLDWGCGHGMASISMARRGAIVFSLDLSNGYCKETLARANANEFLKRIHPIQGDACRLPFKNECFDGIWGNAILHHLATEKAAVELHRVLKPKGIMVLCDPWQGSTLVRWIRNHVPYPGKDRTQDEQPLNEEAIAAFRSVFPNIEISFWDIFGALNRFISLGPFSNPIRNLDRFLIKKTPGFARTARYVMIKAMKN
jgi:SAM-dependent methyltransferase